MRRLSLLAGVVLLGLAPLSATAQEVGNASRGQGYARNLCSDCHSVERVAGKSTVEAAPPFAKLAKTSGMTAMAISAWMTTSHPTMPNVMVPADKMDDIIAYILAMRG